MPTIIDSLFLELGIDTAKFSVDQQKSLKKIAEFESQAVRSAKKSSDAVKTVGQAFKDLARDSRIGASGVHLDSFAKKLKDLGQSARAAGGAGTPFGIMAQGLGMLLSPAALGIAAVGLLGKEMWDLNKNMTATNATMFRQAQLSGISAKNMWAYGEAARLVGANPQDVTGGIAGLQTAVLGMGIGAGDATSQLVALSRLGVGFNFKKGVNIPQLMEKVHKMAAKSGYENLGALRALTGPVMNDAMFNIATSKDYNPKQIEGLEPKNLGDILQNSLKSQMALGKLEIDKDILAEVAYGGEQGLMSAVVTLLRNLLEVVTHIFEAISHPIEAVKSAWHAVSHNMGGKMSQGMRILMGQGLSQTDAAAIMGNAAQESSLDPFATNGRHAGLFQLNKARQANFAKMFGYSIGASGVSDEKQFNDQVLFSLREPEYKAAARAMAKAKDLLGKTRAYMNIDEAPGDNSLGSRWGFSQDAMHLAEAGAMRTTRPVNVSTSETHIGELNINTPSTDPETHGDIVLKKITQPLASPTAQGTTALSTRGMVR